MTTTCADPFTFAWKAADPVAGWLSRDEALLLFRAALAVPPESTIIEVGAFCGRSTRLLAESRRQIITIDPLTIGDSIAKTPIDETVVASLQAVVDAYENVTWIRERSTDVLERPTAQMIFVDAVHKYPDPYNDFIHFRPGLQRGALAAFHDYGREFGVTKSVTELELEGAITRISLSGTMYLGKVL